MALNPGINPGPRCWYASAFATMPALLPSNLGSRISDIAFVLAFLVAQSFSVISKYTVWTDMEINCAAGRHWDLHADTMKRNVFEPQTANGSNTTTFVPFLY